MSLRVLRAYHSAVVDEFRERERWLIRKHGHEVQLICPPAWSEGGSDVRATEDPEFPVRILPLRGPRHPILFWYGRREFRAVLRDFRPDVIDLHEEPYSLSVAAALRVIDQEAPGTPVCVYTAQNIYKRYPPPIRQLEQRAIKRAAAAFPCSTEAGEVLRAKGFDGPVHVIPLGVTMPDSVIPAGERELRVGFVGRLEPYKGTMVALEAFAEACKQNSAVLEFVGAGSQDAELRGAAEALGLGERVRFRGALPQAETLEMMGRFAVLVVPSLTTSTWKEQFGRVAAQAMAAGTPIIASDSGSLREVVEDAGLLVPENDVPALAAALRRLLEDASARQELAAKARARAAAHFTWERVADACDAMYREMVREPAVREPSSAGP
jgi:glycosyltransferase involved in cell wall biosynthesis